MYLVVSHWEANPGREAEFDKKGDEIGALLRGQPGVEFVEVFTDGRRHTAIHAYRDEAAYRAIVESPNGPFASAVANSGIEELGRWVDSERGESRPHA